MGRYGLRPRKGRRITQQPAQGEEEERQAPDAGPSSRRSRRTKKTAAPRQPAARPRVVVKLPTKRTRPEPADNPQVVDEPKEVNDENAKGDAKDAAVDAGMRASPAASKEAEIEQTNAEALPAAPKQTELEHPEDTLPAAEGAEIEQGEAEMSPPSSPEIKRSKRARRNAGGDADGDDEDFVLEDDDNMEVSDGDHDFIMDDDMDDFINDDLDGSPPASPVRLTVPKKTKGKKGTKKNNVGKGLEKATIDELFKAIDRHENGRFTVRDLQKVADDHGQFHTAQELADMLHFWDTSGTNTIDLKAFQLLVRDVGL